MSSWYGLQVQNTEGAAMRIRIGDRVRLKQEKIWGTVVWYGNRSQWKSAWVWMIRLDAGVCVDRTTRQIEKLPRYRGYPQARDMKTAMRHLQEFTQ